MSCDSHLSRLLLLWWLCRRRGRRLLVHVGCTLVASDSIWPPTHPPRLAHCVARKLKEEFQKDIETMLLLL